MRTAHHVTHDGDGDLFFVGTTSGPVGAGPAAQTLYEQLAGVVRRGNTQIVQERIFGSVAVQVEVLAARVVVLSEDGPPVLC